MESPKQKLLEQLERLPEPAIEKVLNYADFLISLEKREKLEGEDVAWLETALSHLGEYEAYDWQPGELGEGLPVKYVPGTGIVIDRE